MKDNSIPVISQLMKSVILEDYTTADSILSDKDFDPNETTKTWGAPVLTALITVLSGVEKIQDKQSLKEIFKRIASNPKFDPNIKDAEGETVLMHIARSRLYNWLVPFILLNGKVDLTITNFMHKTAIQIAQEAGNTVMVDVLLTHKRQNHKGLPKKRVGLPRVNKTTAVATVATPKKVSVGNSFMIERVEVAFDGDAKANPFSMYHVLKAFMLGEYDKALAITQDVRFNPNELDRWDEPALSALIYFSQDNKCEYDDAKMREIAESIIKNRHFDVNVTDADNNTTLMVAMAFRNLHWLIERLFNKSDAKLDVVNDEGFGLSAIASRCGNGEFYNHLIRKCVETANVVS